MKDLYEKLNNIPNEAIEMVEDTRKLLPKSTPNDMFPMDLYRPVEIDGKMYRLHVEISLKEI